MGLDESDSSVKKISHYLSKENSENKENIFEDLEQFINAMPMKKVKSD